MKIILDRFNYSLIILLGIFLVSCTNLAKREIARQAAERTLNDIASGNYDGDFPAKYFPKKQTDFYMERLKDSCFFQNRKGNYINDFYKSMSGGPDRVTFIYEYYLKCDSLRFMLTYNLGDPIELFSLHFEKLSEKNSMIINKDRQLKY